VLTIPKNLSISVVVYCS